MCDRGASGTGIKPPLYASVSPLRSGASIRYFCLILLAEGRVFFFLFCPRLEYTENLKREMRNVFSHSKHAPKFFVAPLDTRGPGRMKAGQQDKTLARCQSTKPEPKPHLLLQAGWLVPGSRTASKRRPAHIPLHCACKPRPHQGQLCLAKCQQTQMTWHGATNLHTLGWAEVCFSSQEQGEMWEQP